MLFLWRAACAGAGDGVFTRQALAVCVRAWLVVLCGSTKPERGLAAQFAKLRRAAAEGDTAFTMKSIAVCEGNTPATGRFDVQNPVETGF
jgi:hypothetical protein